MLVKFIGKQDGIVVEYDGKKYGLTRNNPVREIPDVVFSYIKASNTPLSPLVVPYQPPAAEVADQGVVIADLQARIDYITEKNKKLKARIKKLLAKCGEKDEEGE